MKDYHGTIEKECDPIGYAVNAQLAIVCLFLCDADEKLVQKLGTENYAYFIYGLGHYTFFEDHNPGNTDIWHEYKTKPREFSLPEARVQD